MQRSNPFHSIRWRIVAAYFFAIAMSLLVIFTVVSGLVEDYLVQRAASEYVEIVQKYSVQLAPMMSKSDADGMLSLAKTSGNEIGGRILVVDKSSIVQVDGFSTLNGRKLNIKEINTVLEGSSDSEYGYYQLPANPKE